MIKIVCVGKIKEDYLVKGIEEYLKRYSFKEEAIENAIDKLKSYGYINDSYYAKTSAQNLSLTKGKRYIENQLLSKGISKDKIQEALNEIKNEKEICFYQTKKWLKGKTLPLDLKQKQKLFSHLVSKGFSYDSIKHAISKIDSSFNFDDWLNNNY